MDFVDALLIQTKLEAEIKRKDEALKEIARQKKSDEWEEEGDTEGGYNCLIDIARKALEEVK